jgi:hypothetical protein
LRSDESTTRRASDRDTLRRYLDGLAPGKRIPINEWYQIAERLGLGRSDRQRLSELREEGYQFTFDTKAREYYYQGWNGDSQQTLF